MAPAWSRVAAGRKDAGGGGVGGQGVADDAEIGGQSGRDRHAAGQAFGRDDDAGIGQVAVFGLQGEQAARQCGYGRWPVTAARRGRAGREQQGDGRLRIALRVRHFDQAGTPAAKAGARRQSDGEREAGGGGGIRRIAALVEDLLCNQRGLRFIGHRIAKNRGGSTALPQAGIARTASAQHFMGDAAARQQRNSRDDGGTAIEQAQQIAFRSQGSSCQNLARALLNREFLIRQLKGGRPYRAVALWMGEDLPLAFHGGTAARRDHRQNSRRVEGRRGRRRACGW